MGSVKIRKTVWSNFEIADMDFWRGEAYSAFFEYLDSQGGFYYEVMSSLHHLPSSLPKQELTKKKPPPVSRETALGRRARAHDRGCALRGNGPHPLFPRDRVRARSVHALSRRDGNMGARSVRV
jgi:hypothetical protein